jgi:hypothetical protein
MRIASSFLLAFFATSLAWASQAASPLQAEAGVSYFVLRHTRFESGATAFRVDEPHNAAPFVALTRDVSDTWDVKLSYRYLNNVRTTVQFGSPPGSMLPVVVWGHYDDDVHMLTAAPEFKWRVASQLTFAIAPEVNWVASRGVVSYSTNNATVLLVGPRRRNDDGFTLGASARWLWTTGSRWAMMLGYEYVDLDPSFDREAHVFSGGVQWRF